MTARPPTTPQESSVQSARAKVCRRNSGTSRLGRFESRSARKRLTIRRSVAGPALEGAGSRGNVSMFSFAVCSSIG